VHRFGDGEAGRMLIAGIHGGSEWNTIALADELIAHLHEHIEIIPPGMSLFILRSLNPDGEARARGPDGRVNANGVDLNRNWPVGWRPNWPRQGCWSQRPTTAGSYPASEPETQALMRFLLSHEIDALINYHSAALGIFPSGEPHDPRSIHLAQAIAAVSPYPYPPIDTGCHFSGTLVDWALQQGIVGVDLELRNHQDTDFEINLRVLSVLLAWEP
jgi:predicted deacylase